MKTLKCNFNKYTFSSIQNMQFCNNMLLSQALFILSLETWQQKSVLSLKVSRCETSELLDTQLLYFQSPLRESNSLRSLLNIDVANIIQHNCKVLLTVPISIRISGYYSTNFQRQDGLIFMYILKIIIRVQRCTRLLSIVCLECLFLGAWPSYPARSAVGVQCVVVCTVDPLYNDTVCLQCPLQMACSACTVPYCRCTKCPLHFELGKQPECPYHQFPRLNVQ